MTRKICIEIWPSDNLHDKLDTVACCYEAVSDLISGIEINPEQRDNIGVLLHLLGELHEKILDGLRETVDPQP